MHPGLQVAQAPLFFSKHCNPGSLQHFERVQSSPDMEQATGSETPGRATVVVVLFDKAPSRTPLAELVEVDEAIGAAAGCDEPGGELRACVADPRFDTGDTFLEGSERSKACLSLPRALCSLFCTSGLSSHPVELQSRPTQGSLFVASAGS
jgi:hypothetical protein